MNIPSAPPSMHKIKDKGFRDLLSEQWAHLSRAINGKLDFGSPENTAQKSSGNLDGVWPGTLAGGYTITTPGAANTEFTVTHNLGRIPTGYDVKSIDGPGIVYDSRKNLWTATQMF